MKEDMTVIMLPPLLVVVTVMLMTDNADPARPPLSLSLSLKEEKDGWVDQRQVTGWID